MKRKNLVKTALLLSAVMTLTSCGSSNRTFPYFFHPAIHSLSMGYIRDLTNGRNTVIPERIDEEHEEALESIFDNINLMGANLSLPMNVSDLPEGFMITDSDFQAVETCDGKYITQGTIAFGEDIELCSQVFILRGKKQDVSEGIIVGFKFWPLFGNSLVYVGDGYNALYMSPSEVTELLGETNIIDNNYDYLIYTDVYGRRAGWAYDGIDSENGMAKCFFTVTAHSALDYEHTW